MNEISAGRTVTPEQFAGVIRGLDNADEYCGRTQAYDSQRAIREAAAAIALMRALAADLTKVVEDFMPNVGRCVLQDYGRLNDAMFRARCAGLTTTK